MSTSPSAADRFPQPGVVVEYLRKSGWTKVKSYSDLGEVWRSDEADRVVLVPLDPSTIDYGTRMYQLLNDLADIAGEPMDAALVDLLAMAPH